MSEGVGIVEAKRLELKLPEGGFKLETGGVLKQIVVQYEECGAPIGEDNVIYICHALTGDAHVAGIRPGETKPSGWWEEMIGPGRAIDTNRFHVICANVLGGCSGTTGPRSINPDTGRPYGSAFPQYTMSDAVDVFRLLLKQLGVKHLAAVIGGSYGGIQAMDWVTRCPDEMDRACLIATSASLNTRRSRSTSLDAPRSLRTRPGGAATTTATTSTGGRAGWVSVRRSVSRPPASSRTSPISRASSCRRSSSVTCRRTSSRRARRTARSATPTSRRISRSRAISTTRR